MSIRKSIAPERPIKSIGLIYADDPETWFLYRRQIDEQLSDRFGRQFRPRLLGNDLHSVALEAAMQRQDWAEVERLAACAARQCIAAGAEGIVLCSSPLHVAAPAVRASLGMPLFHLTDSAINILNYAGVKRVGLLGTRFDNELRMWQDACRERGVATTVPSARAMERVTRIIREELTRGTVSDAGQAELFRIAADFHPQGASMIVLVAPELQLALNQETAPLPVMNAMALQVSAAITWATGMTLPGLPPAPPCEAAA